MIRKQDVINILFNMRGVADEDGYILIYKTDAIDEICALTDLENVRIQYTEWLTYPQITEAVNILLEFMEGTNFDDDKMKKWLEDIKRYCIDHTAI